MNQPAQQPAQISLSEDEFYATYEPILAPSGDMFTYDEIKDAPLNTVWTIVEGDDDVECDDGEFRANSYAIPGIHFVNREGYILSKVAWPHENIEALYFDVRD